MLVSPAGLNNPDMSLANLCKLSKAGLTRSGLNHRLKKLLELAEEIKEEN